MTYIGTVSVYYEIQAKTQALAKKVLQEKAFELAPIVGDFGAFETEATQIRLDHAL